jgi:hypothetical protein
MRMMVMRVGAVWVVVMMVMMLAETGRRVSGAAVIGEVLVVMVPLPLVVHVGLVRGITGGKNVLAAVGGEIWHARARRH